MRDPITDKYIIVSGVKSDQGKRLQHAVDAPLYADEFLARIGEKKKATECRLLASIHANQS